MTQRPNPFAGIALIFCTFSVNAQDIQQPSSDHIAIIGSSVISEEEVERIAAGRPRAYADLSVDERRAQIIGVQTFLYFPSNSLNLNNFQARATSITEFR
jgi:hypothetical protein